PREAPPSRDDESAADRDVPARGGSGRLARVVGRTLWTTDGRGPPTVAGLPPGSVLDAVFADAGRGLALLANRALAWTGDGGRAWAMVPDAERVQRVFLRGGALAFEQARRAFVLDAQGRATEATGAAPVAVLSRALRARLLPRLALEHPGVEFGARVVAT